MPINITSPNSAKFVVEFIDSSGDLTQPTSASITLTYFISGTSNSSTIDLSRSGSFWTATWSSDGVDVPSDVNWGIYSSLGLSAAQTGVIRIIDP